MEADRKKPEMPPPERFSHEPSGRFWIPVIDSGKNTKYDRTNKHIVEVSDYEIRIMKLPIPGRYGKHDAGKPCNEELKKESYTEQHRSCKTDSTAPKGRDPVENLDACRNTY